MKQKLKISVSEEVAEILGKQRNKSAYVEKTVLWYARFGEECLEKLNRVVEILSFLEDSPEAKIKIERYKEKLGQAQSQDYKELEPD